MRGELGHLDAARAGGCGLHHPGLPTDKWPFELPAFTASRWCRPANQTPSPPPPYQPRRFFQFTFAATGATIISGAVAERCKFEAYMVGPGMAWRAGCTCAVGSLVAWDATARQCLCPGSAPLTVVPSPSLPASLQLYELMIVMFVYPIVAHWCAPAGLGFSALAAQQGRQDGRPCHLPVVRALHVTAWAPDGPPPFPPTGWSHPVAPSCTPGRRIWSPWGWLSALRNPITAANQSYVLFAGSGVYDFAGDAAVHMVRAPPCPGGRPARWVIPCICARRLHGAHHPLTCW